MAELSGIEIKSQPDIVFFDINVRRMNEMLALGKIRENKAFINISICRQFQTRGK
jgi:hypothetical protein